MKKLIIIIGLIYCITISAAEPDSLKTHPEPKYQLAGVSIVAEKPTQAIGKIDIKTWDERDIKSETNIAEAMNDVSGINISKGGKSNSELSIRGFNKEDVMIMIDGRPLGGGYFDAVDLSSLPVGDIKEIQVIKGPASALYGTNTMGGVVNIISARPDNSSWIKAKLQVQRNNTMYYKLSSAHKFSNWDYLVSLAHYQTDGFQLSSDFQPVNLENGGLRDNSAQSHNDFHAKLNYKLFDLHQIGFTASYTLMDERQIPAATNEFYNPAYPQDIFRKFVDWKRYQFSTQGDFILGWNQKLSCSIYYDGYDDIYQTYYYPDYSEMRLNSRLLSTNIGSVFKYSLEQDNYDLIAGYRIEKQAFNRQDNGEYQVWTGNWQLLQNPFCQMEIDLAKLKLTFGSGLSVFYQNQRDNWIYHIEPSLGVFYKTDSFGQYNLAVSNNVNYPALHELFSESSGNPELKEESAWKYEISTQQPFAAGSFAGNVDISVFYNAVNDMVEKVYYSSYSLYENIDQVNSYGFEAAFKSKFVLEHNIQYRYLEYAKNSDRPLYENPQNIININEKVMLPYDIFFVYDASWHDISHSDDEILPAYWLHNFYLNRTFNKFKVKLGIENAFDENYQEKSGYPQPGRDLILTLEASIL
ncbi:MAG: TonB-dependent receptor plug domain-containing protein [Candidatus Stygibacter frigidus]|nr:TonB-dependent receptor plug domain-containing protein [Candidatus Stygibacter frigidus]